MEVVSQWTIGLRGMKSHKIALFKVTAVRTSNSTTLALLTDLSRDGIIIPRTHAQWRCNIFIIMTLWKRYLIKGIAVQDVFQLMTRRTCSWGEVNTLMTIFKTLKLRLQRVSIYPGNSTATVKMKHCLRKTNLPLRHKSLVLDNSHPECRGLLPRNCGLPNWLKTSLQHNTEFLWLPGLFLSYLLILYQQNIKGKAR
jgi:hypothetical protein